MDGVSRNNNVGGSSAILPSANNNRRNQQPIAHTPAGAVCPFSNSVAHVQNRLVANTPAMAVTAGDVLELLYPNGRPVQNRDGNNVRMIVTHVDQGLDTITGTVDLSGIDRREMRNLRHDSRFQTASNSITASRTLFSRATAGFHSLPTENIQQIFQNVVDSAKADFAKNSSSPTAIARAAYGAIAGFSGVNRQFHRNMITTMAQNPDVGKPASESRIEKLNKNCTDNTEFKKRITELFRHSSVLKIPFNTLSGERSRIVFDVLSKTDLPNLRTVDLNFYCSEVSPNDINDALLGINQRNPTSEIALGFAGRFLGDQVITALLPALKECNVTELGLVGNKITCEGIKQLAPALHKLVKLDLSGNSIRNTGAKALGDFLATDECKLKHLDLGNNSIYARGAEDIARGFSTLTYVNLGHNFVGTDSITNQYTDAGGMAIAEALKDSDSQVKYLNLRGNRIGGNGTRAIVGAAGNSSSSIKNLNVQDNNMSTETNHAIAKALAANPQLQIAHGYEYEPTPP